MSTVSAAELVATYKSIILVNRTIYAEAALVIFEHIVNFKYEIQFFRRHKWSAATWIFLINRYLLLSNVLFQVIPSVPKICNNSPLMNTLNFFTSGNFSTFPIQVFTILRAFALLHDHSWRRALTWTLIVPIVTLGILDSYLDFTLTWNHVDDPVLGASCTQTGYTISPDIIIRVSTAGPVVGIIGTLFLLYITLMKTARQVQQASILGLKTTLSEILLRYGSLFFLVILAKDLIVVVYFANQSLIDADTADIIAPLLSLLPLILLSRFIINLRQDESFTSQNSSGNQLPSRFSIPNFRMPDLDDVVGNLGEPLDFVEYRLDDEDGANDDDAAARDASDTFSPVPLE